MHSGTDFDEELILMDARADIHRAENIGFRIAAMHRSDLILTRFMVGASLAAVVLSFIFSAIPESNRMAKAQQENVSYANR